MSTDIDPEGMEGFEPAAEEEAAPDYGVWNQWQQAGIDPNYNPYDARKAINLNNALSDPGHRAYALEQVLKGHELPEGMSWDEARQAIQQAAQQREQDPWESVLQPGEPEGELLGYDPSTGEPVYANDPQQYQQQGFDPASIKAAVEEQIRRERMSWEQERQRADQERQQGEEFERAIADVRMKDNLTEADTRWLVPATIANLQGSMQGASMAEAATNTWNEMKAWRNQSAAQMAADQQNVPQTRTPSGPTPSANQPPQNLSEARERAGDFFNG